MREDSPKIVNLEPSLELSEFFSEMDLPSEVGLLPATATPAPVAPAEPTVGPVPKTESKDEPTDEARPHLDESIHPNANVEESVRAIAHFEAPAGSDATVDEPVRASAHTGPATVTEFPVRPQTPPAVALPSLPPGPVSLVELIERHNGFDWREAVAVIRQICLYLRDHSPQAPILLDPRTIQITDKGEVRLLSGQTSSDPLVIQVGRLLRTMLMGKEAPPELRLLLSQATFELPIFESIEDVDRALAQLDKLDEPGPTGMALLRAVAAPAPPPSPEDQRGDPPPIRPIFPMKRGTGRRKRSRSQFGMLLGGYASHVAAILAASALIGLLFVTRPEMLFPAEAPARLNNPVASIEIATAGDGSAAPDRAATAPNVSAELAGQTSGRASPTRASADASAPARTEPDRRGGRDPDREPSDNRRAWDSVNAGVSPATGGGLAPTNSASSLRDSERRATSLLEQGQTAAASIAFDALVMRNPLYEPRTSDLTPEALSAFRTSQRQQLPAIAQRNYERAKAALASGDADRALALAKESWRFSTNASATPGLSFAKISRTCLREAKVAAAAANEIIYRRADADVIPPRALSRQMPVTLRWGSAEPCGLAGHGH